MALVDYSSDEENDEDQELTPSAKLKKQSAVSLKRKCNYDSDLPPLPSKLYDMYATSTRLSTGDDPSLHGGRKRTSPHVEGHWPSHVYIEWHPSTKERDLLCALIETLESNFTPIDSTLTVNSFLFSDLGAPLPLHISLSRSIQLTTLQKDHFLCSLQQLVESSGVRPFYSTLIDLEWVANFEKTRWFLVLRVSRPDANEFNRLLHLSNIIAQRFDQPRLYSKPDKAASPSMRIDSKAKNPCNKSCIDWSDMQDVSAAFHVSIAWTLRPPSQELINVTEHSSVNLMKSITQINLQLTCIKVKIGNTVNTIPLLTKIVETKGVFGN
ncbi:hypothetical protein K3495_g13162 [Podosphaera aphanis]|nr:hypothetical protein K3495_g13162 [Podosphaera aphanis]